MIFLVFIFTFLRLKNERNLYMTANEKSILSHFLNLAGGYAGSGYSRETSIVFKDDPQPDENQKEPVPESTLPLAYLVDEDDPGTDNPLVLIIGGDFTPEESQYLDRMLAAIGLYINKNCLVLNDDESRNLELIEKQISITMPKAILYLGGNPENKPQTAVSKNIPVFSTYRPNELMKNESLKQQAFKNMKSLMAALAELDMNYAGDVKNNLAKYAAADAAFAARVRKFIS